MPFETTLAVGVDTRRAQGELRRFDASLKRTGSTARRQTQQIGGSFDKLKGRVFAVTAAITAMIGVFGGRAIIDTTSKFEDLQEALDVVFREAGGGEAAFKRIQDVAAKMPINIDEITKAFITLKASGIEPTSELMMQFSDVASVTTNRLDTFRTMVRLLSRSVGGGVGLEELNQLADRGIPVWVILEEEIGRSRSQLEGFGTTAKEAKEIMDGLQRGLSKRFGGATQKALDNMSTAASNFSDSVDKLSVSFAKMIGLDKAFTDSLNAMGREMSLFQMIFETIRTKGFGAYIDAMIKATLEGGFFADNSERLAAILNGILNPALEETAKSAEKVDTSLSKAGTALLKSLQDEANSLANQEMGFGEGNEGKLARFAAQQKLLNLQQREGLELTPQQTAQFDRLFDSIEQGTNRLRDMEQAQQIFEEVRTPLESYNKQMERLNDLYSKTLINQETFNRGQRQAIDAMIEADPVISGVRDGMHQFSDSLVDAAANGESFADTVKATFRGLATDIIKSLNRVLINKAFAALFGDVVGGGLNFFGGGGSSGGGVSTGGGAPFVSKSDLLGRGNVLNTGFPRAAGGPVNAGGSFLVGERGPELFTPSSSGNITPNGSMGNGTTIVIDARGSNGDAAVEAAVERGIRRAAPQLINASVKRVQNERRRDPKFFGQPGVG